MKKLIITFFITVLAKTFFGQPSQITQSSIDNYLKENADSLNSIEGIWDVASTLEYYHHDTLYDVVKSPEPIPIAVIKKEDKYQSYNLSGKPYEVEFSPTDVKGVYLYRIYFPQANQHTVTQAVISKLGQMEYTYDLPDWYFGIKPTSNGDEGLRIVNVLKWKKRESQNKDTK